MIGPLSYVGGKNRLATTIIKLIPEHIAYVEPFAGGAQVLFHKKPSRVEVINDLSFDIVNFFRVCQWHHGELVRYLQYTLISRKWYELFAKTDPETLTDIQRAARFFYIQKNSFGGLVLNPRYHYGVTQRPNYNPKRIAEILTKTHERLQNVQIESLPYEEILEKYDRTTTLFYLDPPYWDRALYRFNFTREDFEVLESRLGKISGKFILSLNDHPDVRSLFRTFTIREADIVYTAKTHGADRYPELLISNF